MCAICGGYLSSNCPECGNYDQEMEEPEYDPCDNDPEFI